MAQGIREWLSTPSGKIAVGAIFAVAFLVFVWNIVGTFGGSPAAAIANERTFIDAETLEPFSYTLKSGDMVPIDAPSGPGNGYPAEACYWTADGQIKDDPTWVLLNGLVPESSRGPTFCPDCDRLVVSRNPQPGPQSQPPPTPEELEQDRSLAVPKRDRG
ncbi:MAG: hypothetical protein AAF911_15855 [Planctomycetota bacterium]